MADYYGGTPWGAVGTGGQSYQGTYAGASGQQGNAALTPQQAYAANEKQYQNIIQGYQQQQVSADRTHQELQRGYNALTGQVVGELRGSQASALQDLQNQYQHNTAATQQQLLGQGLGNTTAAEGVQRGNEQVYNQGLLGVNSQYAQMIAGAMGQYGSQAMGYGVAGNQQRQQLQTNQLGFMGQNYGNNQQFANSLAQGQSQFGYQTAMGQQGAQNQAALNAQQFGYQQLANEQGFQYQQSAADADLRRQNEYDLYGGGYAGG